MKIIHKIRSGGGASFERVLRSAGVAVLVLWIAGILFPFEWPARLSTTYRAAFSTVFFAPWTHEPTHFALFLVLGCLLSWLLQRASLPLVQRYAGAAFTLAIVSIALSQEGIQLLYLHRSPGPAEVLDVGVDLAGAATGAISLWLWTHRRARGELGQPGADPSAP